MRGRSSPAHAIRLLLPSNMDLAAIQNSVLASANNSLGTVFAISFLYSHPVRCKLVLAIDLFFGDFLCALLI